MSHDELNEREAADLLRRAARLQARAEERGPGLTLDEVMRAAEAAGIDPIYVQQAALGAGDDLPPSEPFLGMQTGAQQVRVVPGRVSDDEWGQMVATLRRQLGGTGKQESIGGVREWRRDPYRIVLETEGENTRISASAHWRGDAIGATMFLALMAMMVVLMTVATLTKGDTTMWAVTAMFAAGTLGGGVAFWPRLWAKGSRIEGKLARALDTMAGIAGREERAEALASAPDLPAGRIDPTLLDDSPGLGAEADGHGLSRTRS